MNLCSWITLILNCTQFVSPLHSLIYSNLKISHNNKNNCYNMYTWLYILKSLTYFISTIVVFALNYSRITNSLQMYSHHIWYDDSPKRRSCKMSTLKKFNIYDAVNVDSYGWQNTVYNLVLFYHNLWLTLWSMPLTSTFCIAPIRFINQCRLSKMQV